MDRVQLVSTHPTLLGKIVTIVRDCKGCHSSLVDSQPKATVAISTIFTGKSILKDTVRTAVGFNETRIVNN